MNKNRVGTLSLKRWLLIAIGLGVALLLAFVITHSVSIVQDELHKIQPLHTSVMLPDSAWQDIKIGTSDNLRLAAWYSPAQNGQTIVVMHGFGGDRNQILPVARILRAEGFGVLAYDTRAHGQSEGTQIGYGRHESLDLKAALDWLEQHEEVDVTRIGVYGFSLGGFIAAQEAVDDLRVSSLVLASTPSSIYDLAVDEGGGGLKGELDAVIRKTAAKLAGRSRYDHSTLEAVKAIGLSKRPVLLIAGEVDEVVPASRTKEIFEAAEYPKDIVLFPNAGHGEYVEKDAARFQNIVVKHFKRTLDKRRVISGR